MGAICSRRAALPAAPGPAQGKQAYKEQSAAPPAQPPPESPAAESLRGTPDGDAPRTRDAAPATAPPEPASVTASSLSHHPFISPAHALALVPRAVQRDSGLASDDSVSWHPFACVLVARLTGGALAEAVDVAAAFEAELVMTRGSDAVFAVFGPLLVETSAETPETVKRRSAHLACLAALELVSTAAVSACAICPGAVFSCIITLGSSELRRFVVGAPLDHVARCLHLVDPAAETAPKVLLMAAPASLAGGAKGAAAAASQTALWPADITTRPGPIPGDTSIVELVACERGDLAPAALPPCTSEVAGVDARAFAPDLGDVATHSTVLCATFRGTDGGLSSSYTTTALIKLMARINILRQAAADVGAVVAFVSALSRGTSVFVLAKSAKDAMVAALEFQETMRIEGGVVGMAVCTGLIDVGFAGSDRGRTLTMRGDAVDRAVAFSRSPHIASLIVDSASHSSSPDISRFAPLAIKGETVFVTDANQRRQSTVASKPSLNLPPIIASRSGIVDEIREAVLAESDSSAVFVLEGPIGIGKSTLANAVASSVEAASSIYRINANAANSVVGLGPMISFIHTLVFGESVPPLSTRDLAFALEEVFWTELDPEFRPYAALVAPVLGIPLANKGHHVQQLHPVLERPLLTKRVLRHLVALRLPAEQQSLIVIDDAKFVDSASWDFLNDVAAQASKLAFIVCHTTDDAAGDRAFASACPERVRFFERARVLSLNPLTDDDLGALLPPTIPASVMAWVKNNGRGSPFYTNVLMDLVKGRQVLQADSGVHADYFEVMAEEVTDDEKVQVMRRLDLLSVGQRRILSLGAVYGMTFPVRWLELAGRLTDLQPEGPPKTLDQNPLSLSLSRLPTPGSFGRLPKSGGSFGKLPTSGGSFGKLPTASGGLRRESSNRSLSNSLRRASSSRSLARQESPPSRRLSEASVHSSLGRVDENEASGPDSFGSSTPAPTLERKSMTKRFSRSGSRGLLDQEAGIGADRPIPTSARASVAQPLDSQSLFNNFRGFEAETAQSMVGELVSIGILERISPTLLAFSSPIVQQTALASMRPQMRRACHLAIANWLEAQGKLNDETANEAAVAFHAFHGLIENIEANDEDRLRAMALHAELAQLAASIGAVPEALDLYERGVSLALFLDDPAEQSAQQYMFQAQKGVLITTLQGAGHPDAMSAFGEAETLLSGLPDFVMADRLDLLFALCRYKFQRGDCAVFERLGPRISAAAEASGETGRVIASTMVLDHQLLAGETGKVLESVEVVVSGVTKLPGNTAALLWHQLGFDPLAAARGIEICAHFDAEGSDGLVPKLDLALADMSKQALNLPSLCILMATSAQPFVALRDVAALDRILALAPLDVVKRESRRHPLALVVRMVAHFVDLVRLVKAKEDSESAAIEQSWQGLLSTEQVGALSAELKEVMQLWETGFKDTTAYFLGLGVLMPILALMGARDKLSDCLGKAEIRAKQFPAALPLLWFNKAAATADDPAYAGQLLESAINKLDARKQRGLRLHVAKRLQRMCKALPALKAERPDLEELADKVVESGGRWGEDAEVEEQPKQ